MQIDWPRRLYFPLFLAICGTVFAVLAAADKVFGLLWHPLQLATLAYVFLFALVGWSSVRGVQLRPQRRVRLSGYAAVLSLLVLTAGYVFAFRSALKDPTPVLLQAELARGDALWRSGRKDEARLLYREAYRRYPNSFPVLMHMGASYYQVGDYIHARKYYERALGLSPADQRWRALNDLGQTLWMLKEPRKAIELYMQANNAGLPLGERVEWHYRLGWAYFDAGDYSMAVQHYMVVAHAGQKYAAASYYNAACAQAQMLKRTKDPGERMVIAQSAADNLRASWDATSEQERQDLASGIFGSEEQRDPDLEPLRATSAYQKLKFELDATRGL